MTRRRIRTYTFKQMADDVFHVRVETIRRWHSEGLFKVLGYIKKGKWRKVCLVSEDEVIKLIAKKIIVPAHHPELFPKRGPKRKNPVEGDVGYS